MKTIRPRLDIVMTNQILKQDINLSHRMLAFFEFDDDDDVDHGPNRLIDIDERQKETSFYFHFHFHNGLF